VLEKERKMELMGKFARHGSDVGSPEVQIAVLTERIKQISEHFARHPKETNSKRSFMILVGKRKSLLNYLRQTNYERYRSLISELGLRK